MKHYSDPNVQIQSSLNSCLYENSVLICVESNGEIPEVSFDQNVFHVFPARFINEIAFLWRIQIIHNK